MSTKPIRRILFLTPDDDTFIVQRLVMARVAQDVADEVHVACADLGRMRELQELGFIPHQMDLNRGKINPIADLKSLIQLGQLLLTLRPDILHNVSIKSVIYGSLMSRFTSVPRVINLVNGLGYAFEPRDFKAKALNIIAKFLYSISLRRKRLIVIFQNPDDQKFFIEKKLIKPNKSRLIRGSGVDTKKFAFTPAPETTKPSVLFVGRLLWSKGIGDLVEATRILKKKGLSFTLLVIGSTDPSNPGKISDETIEAWEREGLLIWKKRQRDMPSFYAQASIVCLPSTVREGLPLTMLEAASVGRPLVGTDIPGTREIVRDQENGFLVPPGQPAKLAEALEKLILSSKLRTEFGKVSVEIVKKEFSSEHVQRQLKEVYLRLA